MSEDSSLWVYTGTWAMTRLHSDGTPSGQRSPESQTSGSWFDPSPFESEYTFSPTPLEQSYSGRSQGEGCPRYMDWNISNQHDEYCSTSLPLGENPSPIQPTSSHPGVQLVTPTLLGWKPSDKAHEEYELILSRGEKPYLRMLADKVPTYFMPHTVHLDKSCKNDEGASLCQYPNGETTLLCLKAFKRTADLDRHYRNIHAPRSQQLQLRCSYLKCAQNRNKAFTRKDHYRDHLRDNHKEDLGSVKVSKAIRDGKQHAMEDKWLKERKIRADRWRCAKCLTDNKVANSGWYCGGQENGLPCKGECEPHRRQARELKVQEDLAAQGAAHALPVEEQAVLAEQSAVQETMQFPVMPFEPYVCLNCAGGGWVGGVPCRECAVPVEMEMDMEMEMELELEYEGDWQDQDMQYDPYRFGGGPDGFIS